MVFDKMERDRNHLLFCEPPETIRNHSLNTSKTSKRALKFKKNKKPGGHWISAVQYQRMMNIESRTRFIAYFLVLNLKNFCIVFTVYNFCI